MKADIRGAEIFFDIVGASLVERAGRFQERRSALVVHGGPGSDHTSVRARYSRLSAGLQLGFFDQRGHGRSSRDALSRCTLDECVADMEALRLQLNLGPIVSIGTSYGGAVAMAHAARHPDAVSHLVLVATFSHAGYAERAMEIVEARGTPEQQEQCRRLFAGEIATQDDLLEYYRTMGPLYSLRWDAAAAEAGMARAIYAPEALSAAHGPHGFLRALDLRPELGAIRAKTLVIAGRHDWICAPEFSEEIAGHIPGATLEIFDESAHAVAEDEPERCLSTIVGSLRPDAWQEAG